MLVAGLGHALAYVVGAVRMGRRVLFKAGVMALFVTPSLEFLELTRGVVSAVASINNVNALFLTSDVDINRIDLSTFLL